MGSYKGLHLAVPTMLTPTSTDLEPSAAVTPTATNINSNYALGDCEMTTGWVHGPSGPTVRLTLARTPGLVGSHSNSKAVMLLYISGYKHQC